MTKAGVAFLISGVFVYFLASQTQVGWVYLFDAIIWSLLALAAVVPWQSLKSLKVERQVLLSKVTPELAGPLVDEKVEVRLTVTNRGRFARHFIKVLEECPFAPPEKGKRVFFIPRIEPKSITTVYYEVECYKRGYYASAPVTLHAGDPLGLMVRKKSFALPLDVTVYPSYYPMQTVPAADATLAEWGQAVKTGVAAELYGSREYQYGDPLRHIHWRNTARQGQFMLKEFEQPGQGAITAVFGTRHDFGAGRDTTLEYSIKIAASLARFSANAGRSTNIIAGGKPLYDVDWPEAMDYLARLEPGGQTDLGSAVEPGAGQVIVAIVSAKDSDLIPAMEKLVAWGRVIVVLLEGFAPDEEMEELASQLRGDSIDIIRCRAGGLETAIEQLADLRFFGGKPVVV